MALAEQLGADATDAYASNKDGRVDCAGNLEWGGPGWYDIRLTAHSLQRARKHPEKFATLLLDLAEQNRVVVVSAAGVSHGRD